MLCVAVLCSNSRARHQRTDDRRQRTEALSRLRRVFCCFVVICAAQENDKIDRLTSKNRHRADDSRRLTQQILPNSTMLGGAEKRDKQGWAALCPTRKNKGVRAIHELPGRFVNRPYPPRRCVRAIRESPLRDGANILSFLTSFDRQ